MTGGPTAVILGGGAGKRLYPLTKHRSKPAVPVGGRFRLIDIPISNCLHSEVYHVFVLTQFNSASLNRHIVRSFQMPEFLDGFIEVLAAAPTPGSEDWYRGTADAVRRNLWRILRACKRRGTREVLILSGDHLYRMDYRVFTEFHRERGAEISVAMQPVGEEAVADLGIAAVDSSLEIKRFVEKPQERAEIESLRITAQEAGGFPIEPSKPFLASMGIYVFNVDVLEELLESTEHLDFGSQVLPAAVGRYRLMAYPFKGYWEDIGTIGAFYRANLAMCDPWPSFDFFPDPRPFFTRGRSLPPAKVNEAEVDRSHLAEGALIGNGAKIRNSIVGLRQPIGDGAVVEDSVLFGCDYYQWERRLDPNRRHPHIPLGIGKGSVLKGCIVDKDARIGRDVTINNDGGVERADGEGYFIRDGVVVVPKNSVIPDGFRL